MQSSLDLVCVGNVLIDAFLGIEDASKHVRLDEKTNELCVHAGEKIPVENYSLHMGGNACNVAVGVSRLGGKTTLVAETGTDEFSARITNGLAKEHVDTSLMVSSKTPTSFTVGLNFKGERTLFVHHVARKHEFLLDAVHSRYVYLTSLGVEWEEVYKNVLLRAKEKNIALIYNPYKKHIEQMPHIIKTVLAQTDVLCVNKDEAEIIACGRPQSISNQDAHIKKLLLEVQQKGPKAIVMTDGQNGSYLLTPEQKFYKAHVLPVSVVEKTGAGDAFAAGFIAALVANKPLQDGLLWGTVNAASVIGKIGAQEGLLMKEQLQSHLKEEKVVVDLVQ